MYIINLTVNIHTNTYIYIDYMYIYIYTRDFDFDSQMCFAIYKAPNGVLYSVQSSVDFKQSQIRVYMDIYNSMNIFICIYICRDSAIIMYKCIYGF